MRDRLGEGRRWRRWSGSFLGREETRKEGGREKEGEVLTACEETLFVEDCDGVDEEEGGPEEIA